MVLGDSNQMARESLGGEDIESDRSLLADFEADAELSEAHKEGEEDWAKTESGEETEVRSNQASGGAPTASAAGKKTPAKPLGSGMFVPEAVPNHVPVYTIEGWTPDSSSIPRPEALAGLAADEIQYSLDNGVMTARNKAEWRKQEEITRATSRRREMDLMAREKERDRRVQQGEVELAGVAPDEMPPSNYYAVVPSEPDELGYMQYRLVSISEAAKGKPDVSPDSYHAKKQQFIRDVAEGDYTGDYQTAREAFKAFHGGEMNKLPEESWQECIERVASNAANAGARMRAPE